MLTRCPVCDKGGLQSAVMECPQCNADLEAFQLLEELQEVLPVQPSVAPSPLAGEGWDGGKKSLVVSTALASLLLGIGGGYFIPRPNAVVPTVTQNAIIPVISNKCTVASNPSLIPPSPAVKISTPPTISANNMLRTYNLTRDDTLWELAIRYYETGNSYPILLALNPGLGIHFSAGSAIQLPTDLVAARKLLTGLIVEQNSRRLLRYPTVTGDTWQKISRRLYGNTKAATKLRLLNGAGQSKLGTSILIPLTN